MRIAFTLLSCVAVILNSIESSSQSDRILDEGYHPASYETPDRATSCSRSRSPTLRQTFASLLGFEFEDFALIRLSPYINPNRTFELRKYVFPLDKPIRLRKNKLGRSGIPTGEQIVLSTSDGDACAILDKKSSKHTILRAICTLAPGQQNRAKININSGEVQAMTMDEILECPVFTHEPVAKHYAISRLSSPSPTLPSSSSAGSSSTPTEPQLRDRSKSHPLRQTFPSVLRFKFDDLAFIRLVPHNYAHRIFELRIYAFPPDKPILLRTKNRILNPVPTGEQIVLSTPDGDVCAMLLKSSNRSTSLRPILQTSMGIAIRVKIKMSSGAVEEMNAEEIAECPGTAGEPITKSYSVFLYKS